MVAHKPRPLLVIARCKYSGPGKRKVHQTETKNAPMLTPAINNIHIRRPSERKNDPRQPLPVMRFDQRVPANECQKLPGSDLS